MFLKKKTKPQSPSIACSSGSILIKHKDSIEGPTWWTPERSGKQPWLPYADRAAWTTCRAGRRWRWLHAPCHSGSGWMRMTSYLIDKKTQWDVRITFISVFNVKGFKIRTNSERGIGKTSFWIGQKLQCCTNEIATSTVKNLKTVFWVWDCEQEWRFVIIVCVWTLHKLHEVLIMKRISKSHCV